MGLVVPNGGILLGEKRDLTLPFVPSFSDISLVRLLLHKCSMFLGQVLWRANWISSWFEMPASSSQRSLRASKKAGFVQEVTPQCVAAVLMYVENKRPKVRSNKHVSNPQQSCFSA